MHPRHLLRCRVCLHYIPLKFQKCRVSFSSSASLAIRQWYTPKRMNGCTSALPCQYLLNSIPLLCGGHRNISWYWSVRSLRAGWMASWPGRSSSALKKIKWSRMHLHSIHTPLLRIFALSLSAGASSPSPSPLLPSPPPCLEQQHAMNQRP